MATGLEGTLTPEGVRTPEEALAAMEALRAAQANALALQREQATTAARQAAEQYAGLAQAPPPDIAPFAALLNAIQGNVSSVIAQDPSFRQRAEQRTQQSRTQLAQSRRDNLQALRDAYLSKAEEAEKVGNIEEQVKFRGKFETLAKQLEVMEAEKDRENKLAIAKLSQQGQTERTKLQQSGQTQRTQISQREQNKRAEARKAVTVRVALAGKGVNALNANQHASRRGSLANAMSRQAGGRKKAALSNLKTFDLNTRIIEESPEAFIARLRSVDNPAKPGTPLYSLEEIAAAGKRLYTAEERETP